MKSTYTAITASAGSGKTYTLVQKLLLICLEKPQQHTVIQNILALTFTNKAANEMKIRILSWLDAFSADNYPENKDLQGLQNILKEHGEEISLQELHNRAKTLRDYILHNYSVLNISTIDKFNAKLVRSFAYEMGLAKNFNIDIDTNPYLIEAIDQMLDKVSIENPAFASEFIDYIEYNHNNESKINLNSSLLKKAKNFLSDIHYEHLKQNEKFDSIQYKKASKELKEKAISLENEIIDIANKSIKLIENQGFTIEDFAGGKTNSIALFFYKVINKNTVTLRKSIDDEEKAVAKFLGVTSSSSKHKNVEIEAILDTLIKNRMSIITKEVERLCINKFLKNNLLPLKVQQNIHKELALIEDEKDLVLLSKLNILIKENLQREPAPFIYEKIGTRFQHFFLDEFQDTSFMQWQNIIPLRDESVSQDKTSFTIVGDPKQSIYRFRGGDSQIMIDILNHTKKTSRYANIEVLNNNWRSAINIVNFNNDLYQWHANSLKPTHKEIFGKSAIQNPKSQKKGRVKIQLIEETQKEYFYENTADRMHKDIQECLDNGYHLKDITVLCRKNDDIVELITLLSQKKVKYNNEEIFIKSISDSGLSLGVSYTINALIRFIKWQINTDNEQDFVHALYNLNQIGRINLQDFTQDTISLLALSPNERLIKLRNEYNINLIEPKEQYFNLYNTIEYIVNQMKVNDVENDFVLTFLEEVYSITQNSTATKKQLIKIWDEELNEKTLNTGNNLDAIQFMTIHKSKGLEFPIVFIPINKKTGGDKFNDWFPVDNIEGLHSINTEKFDESIAVYNDKVMEFNERNIYNNKIDNLSAQYVATTRPVDQLFLYIEKHKNSNGEELIDFINSKYPDSPDTFDFYEDYDAKNHTTENTKTYNEIIKLSTYNNNDTNSNITIATPSRNYQQKNENIQMGIFIHELLSKIYTQNDVKPTIEKYLLNGIINPYEAEIIQQKIDKTIKQHPKYFSREYDIYNEKEIIVEENGKKISIRPDKLVETNDGIYIVDFKTGTEHSNYEKQIELYKKSIEKLGKKVIGTELVYITP